MNENKWTLITISFLSFSVLIFWSSSSRSCTIYDVLYLWFNKIFLIFLIIVVTVYDAIIFQFLKIFKHFWELFVWEYGMFLVGFFLETFGWRLTDVEWCSEYCFCAFSSFRNFWPFDLVYKTLGKFIFDPSE